MRVPWTEGMTLYAGGAAAQVKLAQRSVALVREGKLVYRVAQQRLANPALLPGDVVRLTGKILR